jgi:hypothetical protein
MAGPNLGRYLGEGAGLKNPFRLSLRMGWRAYESLRHQLEETEHTLLVALGEKLQHMQQKMDKLTLRLACLPTACRS